MSQHPTVSSQPVFESIAEASIAPNEAFARLREALQAAPDDTAAENSYEALRGLVWHIVSSREEREDITEWIDIVLKVRQLLRTKASPLTERFTVLADLLDQSRRFGKFHPTGELLGRKHVRSVLEVLLRHQGTATRAMVAERVGLRDANMSRILANLASAGWIRRRSEGREVVVSLTQEGKAQACTALPKVAAAAAANPFGMPEALEVMQSLWDETGCAAAVSDNEKGLLSCDRKFAKLFGVESPDLLVGTDIATLRKSVADMVTVPDETAPDEVVLEDGSVMRVVETEAGNKSLWLGVDVTPYKRQLAEYQRREKILLQVLGSSSTERSRKSVQNVNPAEHLETAFPMIAMLRNDLLTPINVINSFAQVLARPGIQEAEPTFGELVKGIQTQSFQLRALIRDIVNVGHLGDGPSYSATGYNVVQLHKLIGDVLENILYTTRHAHLSVSAGANSSESVTTDVQALRTMILQVLAGIVELTPQGGKVEIGSKLQQDKIVVSITSENTDRDIPVVPMNSKTLFFCEHAARSFGGSLAFTSHSNSGIDAEIRWPFIAALGH